MASGLQKFVNQVKSTALGVADTFTPVLKVSENRERMSEGGGATSRASPRGKPCFSLN